MGNITLLELNVPDGDIQLGPKSLRGSKPDTDDDETAEPTTEADAEGGLPLGKLLLLGGFIVVVAIMATKILGEDADDEIAGFDDEN